MGQPSRWRDAWAGFKTQCATAFKKRVLWQEEKTSEKNIDLKIQYAVLKQLGPGVF